MTRQEEIQQIINDLTHCERLSMWELNFLESISDQFDSRGTLSDKQFEKLKDIAKDRLK